MDGYNMNAFMTFDKESAQKAGGGDFVSESGCYVGEIQAKAITAGSGSKGIEFSLKTNEGLSANYINIYFEKANGDRINGGYNHLQSLMGLLQVGTLAMPVDDGQGNYWIKELCGKQAGLALQKRMYTKNDGADGYDFQLRAIFDANTLQTYKEKSNGEQAKKVPLLDETMKDIDERQSGGNSQPQSGGSDFDF